MNKFLLLAGITAFTFGAASFAYATEKEHASEHAASHDAHDDHDEETEHYKGIDIKSSEHAFTILHDKTEEIGVIIEKNAELEFLELEAIHEISYSLEAAIDYIRDDKAADDAHIALVDEAIQAVHHTSEDQEQAELREWFKKLNVALAEIKPQG